MQGHILGGYMGDSTLQFSIPQMARPVYMQRLTFDAPLDQPTRGIYKTPAGQFWTKCRRGCPTQIAFSPGGGVPWWWGAIKPI